MVLVVEPACKQAECYFLENFNEEEVIDSVAHTLGTIIFWKNYSDGSDLLRKIRPDKIIFQLIDNYFHIALFFAARHLQKIPIWYMDHGIRYEHGMVNMDIIESGANLSFSRRIAGKKIRTYVALLKNIFFRKTKSKLSPELRHSIQKVFNSRSKNNFAVFMRECGYLLQPDGFIAYSPETFAFHKNFFNLPATYESTNKVHFVGIPSLDNLFWLNSYEPASVRDSFLLIDQGLHEQSLMGWTEQKKIDFIIGLVDKLQKFNLKLKIKPHPWNDSYYRVIPPLILKHIEIINNLNPSSLDDVGIVGSFNSTLLLAFCAAPKFKVVCFEMNPEIVIPSFSYGITKFGVAKEIKKFDELDNLLTNTSERNSDIKVEIINKFIRLMLYKFDDLSSKRFTDAVIGGDM